MRAYILCKGSLRHTKYRQNTIAARSIIYNYYIYGIPPGAQPCNTAKRNGCGTAPVSRRRDVSDGGAL